LTIPLKKSGRVDRDRTHRARAAGRRHGVSVSHEDVRQERTIRQYDNDGPGWDGRRIDNIVVTKDEP